MKYQETPPDRKLRAMHTMTEMMSMSMKEMPGMAQMDMSLMEACIEACSACEQSCTMCSDADMAEGMGRCASMCATCADVCNTMMRMMMRPTGWDMMAMMSMLEATMTMCKACADECTKHAEMSEHCTMCAQVCMECVKACEAMLDSMKSIAV